MFQLSNKTDYALLMVTYLRGKQESFVPLTEIIANTQLPKRFIAQIAAVLVRNRMLQSKEGKVGGYKLIAELQTISVFEFLKMFGDVTLTKCQKHGFNCEFAIHCQHKNAFHGLLESIIVNELQKWTVADLLDNKKLKTHTIENYIPTHVKA